MRKTLLIPKTVDAKKRIKAALKKEGHAEPVEGVDYRIVDLADTATGRAAFVQIATQEDGAQQQYAVFNPRKWTIKRFYGKRHGRVHQIRAVEIVKPESVTEPEDGAEI